MKLLVVLVLVAFGYFSEAGLVRQRRDVDVQERYWGKWGNCSKSCGRGKQQRHLMCRDSITGNFRQCSATIADCNLQSCDDPFTWTRWGVCTADCGGGERSRRTGANVVPGFLQKIHCNSQVCKSSGEGCGKVDAIFVLDSSGSVGDLGWWRAKQFVLDAARGLQFGASDVRIGLVVYATDVDVVFHLGSHRTFAELERDVWNAPWRAGATATAEAIQRMREDMRKRKRADAVQVAVVVTDGASNILAQETVKQAQMARSEDVVMMAVGVGANTNERELAEIASKPTDRHKFHVDDYGGLATVTEQLIRGSCEAASRLKCSDFGSWSDCRGDCGQLGKQRRSRNCTFTYVNGTTHGFQVGEERNCSMAACVDPSSPSLPSTSPSPPTTSPSPPTTQPPPVAEPLNCRKCDWFTPGPHYLIDPTDCSKFFICLHSESQPDGPLTCPANLFWSEKFLTCTWSPDAGHTCVKHPAVPAPSPPPYAPVPVPAPVPALLPNCVDDSAILYFPFDEDLRDHSCSVRDVEVSGDVREMLVTGAAALLGNGAARFSGRQHIRVPFINNYFAGGWITSWTVSVWVKPAAGAHSGVEGIVGNGDCTDTASFQLSLGSGTVVAGRVVTDGLASYVLEPQAQLTQGQWQHVALVYDGRKLAIYVNGSLRQEQAITGAIQNRQCAMLIGRVGAPAGSGYFSGDMDELRIYRSAISLQTVQKLFRRRN